MIFPWDFEWRKQLVRRGILKKRVWLLVSISYLFYISGLLKNGHCFAMFARGLQNKKVITINASRVEPMSSFSSTKKKWWNLINVTPSSKFWSMRTRSFILLQRGVLGNWKQLQSNWSRLNLEKKKTGCYIAAINDS